MLSPIRKILPFIMGLFLGFCLHSIFQIEKFKDNSRIKGFTNLVKDMEIDNSVGLKLEKQVRIICWVMTRPADVKEKLEAIKKTWGKRCTKLLLLSSKDNNETGTIGLPNTEEGRDWLWAKTKEAFKYIYTHHLEEGEWFLKADDDTFFIMENLRYMLSGYDPMEPTYFGCRFKDMGNNESQGYMSGGAGYILSKESLLRFVQIAVDNSSLCQEHHDGSEDLLIGKCLEKVGVKAMDTLDIFKFHRFLPFNPEYQMNLKRGDPDWYWDMTYYPQNVGLECCSNYTISFHYNSPENMYVLEFFIYHLKLFGTSVTFNLPHGNGQMNSTSS